MIAWIALGVATLVAILAILWPAIRGIRPPPLRAEHDAALYRAQLTELDRDRAEGRLSPSPHWSRHSWRMPLGARPFRCWSGRAGASSSKRGGRPGTDRRT